MRLSGSDAPGAAAPSDSRFDYLLQSGAELSV
jgi:hypothetical protein